MKTLQKIIAVFVVTISLASCNKWIDEDINVDPNNPSDASMDLMLPAIETGWAYLLGGDLGRYNSVFTQHHGGVDRQHLGFDSYIFTESDVNNSYEAAYQSVIGDLITMKKKADELKSPHYEGAAKVLLSLVMMQMTDLYGDLPLSEAGQGLDELNPKFDSQESIYNAIFAMCAEAANDLAASESVFTLGDSDFLYAGDLSAWISLAHATAARAHIHLAKRDASHYAQALSEIDLAGDITNAEIYFNASATNANPLYQFMDQRGDIRMGGFLIDMMVAAGDPRLQPFAGDTLDGGIYLGSPAGNASSDANYPGPFYSSIDSKVIIMSAYELKFIEAEAALATGDADRAAAAHNDAVMLSLTDTGVSDGAFETAHAAFDASTITLEEVMSQKYVAMYTQPESWSDWRRTGLPALTPAAGGAINQIPRRWPYPQTERLYNESFPGQVNLLDRVWWDVE